MNYDTRYPCISDLKKRAKRRIPNFAFDYVDGGIDEEDGKQRNREAWRDIELTPRYLVDVSSADLSTTVFGKTYSMPFGVPPVGLGNMMWPGAEMALARASQKANIPYILSTYSTTDLAEIAQAAPDVCWFQLYVPAKVETMKDLISRATEAGYHALVITLDIPVGAKRNRELKNNLKLPFSMTPNIIWQSAIHPVWALNTLRLGKPDFVNINRYKERPDEGLAEMLTKFNMKGVTRERVEMMRDLWKGPLILKGVQYEADMQAAIDIGVDGVIISNHGGRQLDAAPASAVSLRQLSSYASDSMTVMVDSGIRTGLDVVRARALGASMCFSGRSFFWGMGAMGPDGAEQVMAIYRDEIDKCLKQLGCGSYTEMDASWLAS
jgi:isopentenyl diphosphate isomerase/L-lactate dehydrogenase-like FMN-dependent dehydrogenase